VPVTYRLSEDSGIRIHDLLNAIQALSQLSYTFHFLPIYINNLERFYLQLSYVIRGSSEKTGPKIAFFSPGILCQKSQYLVV
jgi:hypothetical protein